MISQIYANMHIYCSHIDWHLEASVCETVSLFDLSDGQRRGFAVVLAEDAPEVAAVNPVPRT
jgi:hypothetical protein